MSPRTRWLACPSGKIPYARSDAKRAVERLRAAGDDDRPQTLNAYRCDQCRRWHVGHSRYAA